jgi:hypothetical protein
MLRGKCYVGEAGTDNAMVFVSVRLWFHGSASPIRMDLNRVGETNDGTYREEEKSEHSTDFRWRIYRARPHRNLTLAVGQFQLQDIGRKQRTALKDSLEDLDLRVSMNPFEKV